MSSTTLRFEDTVDITMNSARDGFPLHEKHIVVLQIDFETQEPVAIPMSLCTIQEEHEVVIAARVRLQVLKREQKLDYIYQNRFWCKDNTGKVIHRPHNEEVYTYEGDQKRGIDIWHCEVESVEALLDTMHGRYDDEGVDLQSERPHLS